MEGAKAPGPSVFPPALILNHREPCRVLRFLVKVSPYLGAGVGRVYIDVLIAGKTLNPVRELSGCDGHHYKGMPLQSERT